MTERKMVAKIIRRDGFFYFVDGLSRVFEMKMNQGRSKKTIEKMKKLKEKKNAERYF